MATRNPQGLRQTGLDQIWDDLKEGIEHVYRMQGISKQRYVELYTYPFSNFKIPLVSLITAFTLKPQSDTQCRTFFALDLFLS